MAEYSRNPTLAHQIHMARSAFSALGMLVISGESGVGKSHLARFIHEQVRGELPIVFHNAASFDEARFESQLFGHAKGAFTGAHKAFAGLIGMAGCGTLVIEDLAALTLNCQAKLLRFIDERKYRPLGSVQKLPYEGALIFTTTTSLTNLLDEDLMRRDFYFRLSANELLLWPLQERAVDFPDIVQQMLHELHREVGGSPSMPDDADLKYLQGRVIPGHLHGLRALLLQSMIRKTSVRQLLASTPSLHHTHLPQSGSLKGDLALLERQLIQRAMRVFPGSRDELAAHLGISRRALMYKLKQYGLQSRGG